MTDAKEKPITPAEAWQPFTPRGVAAFAYATFTRLFIVQLTLALLVFAVALWAFSTRYGSVLRDAVRAMPDDAFVRNGALISATAGPRSLAANPSLEVVLDLRRVAPRGGAADLTVFLTDTQAVICGYLGCRAVPYPAGQVIQLSENGFVPWWGAWRFAIVAGAGAAVMTALFLLWWAAATIMAPVIRLIAFFSDRAVSLAGSWRLCSAAMLPGSALLCGGVALHEFGAVDLLRLGLFAALYVLCSAFFIFASPVFLRRIERQPGNPFATFDEAKGNAPTAEENPFRKP